MASRIALPGCRELLLDVGNVDGDLRPQAGEQAAVAMDGALLEEVEGIAVLVQGLGRRWLRSLLRGLISRLGLFLENREIAWRFGLWWGTEEVVEAESGRVGADEWLFGDVAEGDTLLWWGLGCGEFVHGVLDGADRWRG